MSPLIRYPSASVELPLQFFGSTGYYAVMAAFGTVIIDDTAPFDKRFKSAHRTDIADTRGLLQLTVPVSKPSAKISGRCLTWDDVAISSHGQWWKVHQTSLASAYGRTPFYEFYIDRLKCFFDRTAISSFGSIANLDRASDSAIRSIIGIDSTVIYKSRILEIPADRMTDPPVSHDQIPKAQSVPYYQVRQEKFGFIPGLSILDLIFNMGPETPLILSMMNKGI